LNDAPAILRWGHSALELEISLAEDETPRLVRLGAPGEVEAQQSPHTLIPLVEATAIGHGRFCPAPGWTAPSSASGCATASTGPVATGHGTP
jgi:hypothetical protein